jgi:hypothetical protein
MNQLTQSEANQEAIQFLQTFTKSDFQNDTKTYNKMKAYRSQFKAGKLGPKSIETILTYLGYEKTTIWTIKTPSSLLIDILTD